MGGSAHLEIDTSTDGDSAGVRLTGELDLDGVDAVTKTFAALVEGGATTVRVDMSGVSFLDSSGLRALLSGHQALAAAGGTLRLEDASPAVERVLEITGTRDLLVG